MVSLKLFRYAFFALALCACVSHAAYQPVRSSHPVEDLLNLLGHVDDSIAFVRANISPISSAADVAGLERLYDRNRLYQGVFYDRLHATCEHMRSAIESLEIHVRMQQQRVQQPFATPAFVAPVAQPLSHRTERARYEDIEARQREAFRETFRTKHAAINVAIGELEAHIRQPRYPLYNPAGGSSAAPSYMPPVAAPGQRGGLQEEACPAPAQLRTWQPRTLFETSPRARRFVPSGVACDDECQNIIDFYAGNFSPSANKGKVLIGRARMNWDDVMERLYRESNWENYNNKLFMESSHEFIQRLFPTREPSEVIGKMAANFNLVHPEHGFDANYLDGYEQAFLTESRTNDDFLINRVVETLCLLVHSYYGFDVKIAVADTRAHDRVEISIGSTTALAKIQRGGLIKVHNLTRITRILESLLLLGLENYAEAFLRALTDLKSRRNFHVAESLAASYTIYMYKIATLGYTFDMRNGLRQTQVRLQAGFMRVPAHTRIWEDREQRTTAQQRPAAQGRAPRRAEEWPTRRAPQKTAEGLHAHGRSKSQPASPRRRQRK